LGNPRRAHALAMDTRLLAALMRSPKLLVVMDGA
jgi:hypothetical protein